MKTSEHSLRKLKRATADAVKKAQATGDADAIEQAKENDEFVDDLIRRNGNLTVGDKIRLVSLIERISAWLKDIDWTNIF